MKKFNIFKYLLGLILFDVGIISVIYVAILEGGLLLKFMPIMALNFGIYFIVDGLKYEK